MNKNKNKDITRRAFIYAISGLLREKGMTQYRLSRKLGLSDNAVAQALNSVTGSPTLRSINEYAKALEVEPKEIHRRIDEYLLKVGYVDE